MTKNKIILLVSGLVLFALIAWGTMSGAILEFETDVYKAIHRLPESMAGFFKAVTFFGNPKTIVLLLLGILIFNRKNGIYIVIAAVGSTLLNQILKYTFKDRALNLNILFMKQASRFPAVIQ